MLRFDVRHDMGTLLGEKFDFSVLKETREAYCKAFKRRRTEIRDAIENPALDAISAVRNLLVHKSGKADAPFLAVLSAFLPMGDLIAYGCAG